MSFPVLTILHQLILLQCVDITFAEIHDPEIETVTRDNCFNSTDLSFQYMYTTGGINAAPSLKPHTLLALGPLLLAAVMGSFV